jgi:hypothetical protein
VTGPIRWLPVLENAIGSPASGLPFASVTVARANVVVVPVALSELGLSATVTVAAGPAFWVRVLAPEMLGDTESSTAATVKAPSLMVEVIVAR